jgi:exosome complex component RRP4
MQEIKRRYVIPGDKIIEGNYKPLMNVMKSGDYLISTRVGIAEAGKDGVKVIPLSGVYIPRVNDLVIGKVIDRSSLSWDVDINSCFFAHLPAQDVFGRDFSPARDDMGRQLSIGDLIIARIVSFDRTRDPMLTVQDKDLGKIPYGEFIKISPTRVPRLIGKRGSMIQTIEQATLTRVIIGQNGIVVVTGRDPEGLGLAVKAIKMVEEESHTINLTQRVKTLLNVEDPLESEKSEPSQSSQSSQQTPSNVSSESTLTSSSIEQPSTSEPTQQPQPQPSTSEPSQQPQPSTQQPQPPTQQPQPSTSEPPTQQPQPSTSEPPTQQPQPSTQQPQPSTSEPPTQQPQPSTSEPPTQQPQPSTSEPPTQQPQPSTQQPQPSTSEPPSQQPQPSTSEPPSQQPQPQPSTQQPQPSTSEPQIQQSPTQQPQPSTQQPQPSTSEPQIQQSPTQQSPTQPQDLSNMNFANTLQNPVENSENDISNNLTNTDHKEKKESKDEDV